MDITPTGFSQTLFMLSMTVVNLALFFRWLGLGADTAVYRRVALSVVIFALLVQLPVLLDVPDGLVVLSSVTVAIGLFKMYIATGLGLYFAQALQIPTFRPDGRTPMVRHPLTKLIVLKHEGWLPAVSGSLVFLLVFTGLLFWAFAAKPTELILKNMQEDTASLVVIVTTMLVVALVEELVFRLALQNWLSYAWGHTTRSHWAAILVTTSIWTLGHAGAMDPDWVKFVQMFVMGILLGVLNQRFGIFACIAVHGLFNVIAILVERWALVPWL